MSALTKRLRHFHKVAMSLAQDRLDIVWRAWSSYWFEEKSRARVQLFRKLFAVLMFAFYLIRFFDLELFYSDHGVLPVAVLESVHPLNERYSLLYWFRSDAFLWTVQSVALLCYILLFFGKFLRLASLVAFILHVSFMYRNIGVVYGVDLIATFYLLYLIVMDHAATDAESAKLPRWRQDLSSAAFRFAQIEVCIIYLYSGVHKLKGAGWWSGEAVWQVIANQQLARMDFSVAAHFPTLIVISTYVTLFWEVYFPVLVWPRATRKIMLWIGFMVHLGIAIAANLVVFGLLMTILYALFFEEEQAERILRRIKSLSLKDILHRS